MFEIEGSTLIELEAKLQKLTPESYKVLGHLQTQLRSNGFVNRYFVDSWPDISAVIAIPGGSDKCLGYLNNIVTCFSMNEQAMRIALSSEVLDWNKPIMFGGFPYKYVGLLDEIIAVKGNQIFCSDNSIHKQPCYTMEANFADLHNFNLPKSLKIGELNSEQAELVNDTWEFSKTNPEAYEFVKWTIESQPSVAIYDEFNNEQKLIAFMIRQFYGTIGMLHVEPNYRGKGLVGNTVLNKQSSELHLEQMLFHIPSQNTTNMSSSAYSSFDADSSYGPPHAITMSNVCAKSNSSSYSDQTSLSTDHSENLIVRPCIYTASNIYSSIDSGLNSDSLIHSQPYVSQLNKPIQKNESRQCQLGPRPSCIGKEAHVSHPNKPIQKYESRQCQHGPRPSCIGKEASPMKYNSLCDSGIFAYQAPSQRTTLSSLKSNWNNPDFDASCSTCNDDRNSTTQLQMEFINHISTCLECKTSNFCTVANRMEALLPVVFELDVERTVLDELVMNQIEESSDLQFSRCRSRMTARSDSSNFMMKSLNKSPVTGRRLNKAKRISLKRKIRNIGKFIRKFSNDGMSSSHLQQSDLKILAVI